jgi:hypothetical protein
MCKSACLGPGLTSVLANRRWWKRHEPFPHFWAADLFCWDFYRALETELNAILSRGLSAGPDAARFSRNMPNSDAYAWNFPPNITGPLALFYSRAWHDMLSSLTGCELTGDVNAALHHHQIDSRDGTVHRDLGVGWFSTQPRTDGVNPMDLTRCSYTQPRSQIVGIEPRETVRAVTVIYYLGNRSSRPGAGGETGLYRFIDDPIDEPVVNVPPINNSLLIFENTPISFHSFRRNRHYPRNSVILWLHRSIDAARARWDENGIYRW